MTLGDICSLADAYYIAKHRYEINQDHIASSTLIYSDGTTKHHVNNDGYIHITLVEDATYLIYLDQDGNVFLWIYELISDLKYKEIIDSVTKLRQITGMKKHSIQVLPKLITKKENVESNNSVDTEDEEQEEEDNTIEAEKPEQQFVIKPIINKVYKREDDIYLSAAPAQIVDVNNLSCTECQSTEFSTYTENEDYSIECVCDKCGTKFIFVPSKYYILKKKIVPTNMQDNQILPYLIHRRIKEENDDGSED